MKRKKYLKLSSGEFFSSMTAIATSLPVRGVKCKYFQKESTIKLIHLHMNYFHASLLKVFKMTEFYSSVQVRMHVWPLVSICYNTLPILLNSKSYPFHWSRFTSKELGWTSSWSNWHEGMFLVGYITQITKPYALLNLYCSFIHFFCSWIVLLSVLVSNLIRI